MLFGSGDGPLADQWSVIVAETGLKWQDDGKLALLQVSVMYKVPAVLLVLFLSLHPCALRAQTTNASITGRVTDPSKATVPETKVAAVNLGTNFRYETASNRAGEYTRANLPPGTYRIEVEKFGFKKLIRPDVTLHVQDAPAIDFEMAVGSISDSITVQAGAPLLNTTSAMVSTVVDQTFVENVPLNGRSFQTLLMLTPGVVVQTAYDDQGQFSVNGQRADANYFTVDGVSACSERARTRSRLGAIQWQLFQSLFAERL